MPGKNGRAAKLLMTLGRLSAAAAVAGAVALSADDQNRRDWRDYGGSPDNSRYSTLKQIDKSNVSSLKVAWTYEYGETGFNPIVVNGVVYGKGRNSSLIALDAATVVLDRAAEDRPATPGRHAAWTSTSAPAPAEVVV